MERYELKMVGSRVLWFLGQFIVFIVCIAYINFFYYTNIAPDKAVDDTYGVTNCVITGKQISTRGHIMHHYRADFLVTYIANGTQYQSVASGNGLDHSMTTDELSQQEILDQFQLGNSYPCWYNPITPQIVVLVMRHSWSSTFPLVVPSVVGLIMLFYMLKAVVLFLETSRRKAIERKRRG